jgi:hypothetical protein
MSKYEKDIQNYKKIILEKIHTIKTLEQHLSQLNEKKRDLQLKSQIKSDDQILYENLIDKEEYLKSILNERETTITINERNINDLRNKLQVKFHKKKN